jgi:hypothetical protein
MIESAKLAGAASNASLLTERSGGDVILALSWINFIFITRTVDIGQPVIATPAIYGIGLPAVRLTAV